MVGFGLVGEPQGQVKPWPPSSDPSCADNLVSPERGDIYVAVIFLRGKLGGLNERCRQKNAASQTLCDSYHMPRPAELT